MIARWTMAMAGLGLLFTTGCPKNGEGPAPTERPFLTTEQCQARGGEVIGDIGTGEIHRPDYRCANGEPPLGTIRVEPGEPIPIEGAVCCPTSP